MVPLPNDLLEGVGVSSEPLEDEDYQELPPIDDGIQNDSDDSDGELDVDDEQVDQEELADLLEDAKEVLNAPEAEEESNEEGGRPVNDGVENEPEEENDEEINCDGNMSEQASRSGEDAPSLVSEPKERVKRVSQRPERYNPSTGTSYAQVEYTHNITAQVEDEKKTLEYHESETGIVANIITRLKAQCHAQQFMLGKGLKEFPGEGEAAAKAEISQMHNRTCFKAIAVAELTRRERLRAQEGLMFLTRKRSGTSTLTTQPR